MSREKIRNIGAIAVLVLLLGALIGCLIKNNKYNTTMRVGSLDEAHFDGAVYDFDDISVELTVRGGDAGSWAKDPIYDEDGNELHGASVGTIYEVVVANHSKNIVSDWKIKIPINEMMWLNNNWNSKMEVHQDVQGDEKVLAIDLADYSDYDINLDYYMDHTGPMIPLYPGDYFIYLPEAGAEEKPIAAPKTGEVGEAQSRFGYIMYIPNQTVDYVADFSGGQIWYYMYENPVTQGWFWIITSLIFIWFVAFIVTIILKVKMSNLIKQQEAQKAHDEEMIKQTMQLVVNFIESKDPNTKGHSLRVAEISALIAKKIGFTEEKVKSVYYIGLMHDCGKLNIPDSILRKPAKLTDDEYTIMKKHTEYGAELLKDFTSIEGIIVGANFHHERYDGKGYPSGLVGENIPLVARIIGVADAFDAMNSNRCYRERLPKDVIMRELMENRAKQFDPVALDALIALIEDGSISLNT